MNPLNPVHFFWLSMHDYAHKILVVIIKQAVVCIKAHGNALTTHEGRYRHNRHLRYEIGE